MLCVFIIFISTHSIIEPNAWNVNFNMLFAMKLAKPFLLKSATVDVISVSFIAHFEPNRDDFCDISTHCQHIDDKKCRNCTLPLLYSSRFRSDIISVNKPIEMSSLCVCVSVNDRCLNSIFPPMHCINTKCRNDHNFGLAHKIMLEEYVYFRLLALAFFYNKHTFRIVLALATYNT